MTDSTESDMAAVEEVVHYCRHELIFGDNTDDGIGGVTLHDVRLLVAGTWTDSYGHKPIIYTPKNLSEFQVVNPTGYRVHSAKGRGINDEVGELLNTRYDENSAAIVTDLFFHGLTQASRDTLAVIRRRQEQGLANYVSPELYTHDVQTPDGLEAHNIRITGWIVTDSPACKLCTIPKQMEEPSKMADEPVTTTQPESTTPAPAPEYVSAAEFAKLVARIEAIEKAISDAQKLESDHTTEAERKLNAVSERVKALETAPAGKVNTTTAPAEKHLTASRIEYEYKTTGGY